MEQLRTVRLLGAAGRKFGRLFRLAVKTPAEAVRAIEALQPGFHAWVLEQHQRGVQWRVITDDPAGVDDDELMMNTGSQQIVLAPVLRGAGGIGKVILGVVLIAAAIFIPGAFAFMGASGALGVGVIGASLVMSGVSDMITPTPKLSGPKAGPSRSADGAQRVSGTEVSRAADLDSNLFSRSQGTGGQGECVPLLYGQRRVQAPRTVSFNLGLLGNTREVDTTGTAGLLGYVNEVDL